MSDVIRLLNEVDEIIAGQCIVANKPCTVRNPEVFQARGIHGREEVWRVLSTGCKNEAMIMDWISNGVDVQYFLRHFKGSFKGQK